MRAGYLENKIHQDSRIGVPQGGILSPLLSNVYLHEFDSFMEELIKERSSPEKLISKVNPKIPKYSILLNKLEKEYRETKNKELLAEMKRIRSERNQIPSRIRTGHRIHYVRYADD